MQHRGPTVTRALAVTAALATWTATLALSAPASADEATPAMGTAVDSVPAATTADASVQPPRRGKVRAVVVTHSADGAARAAARLDALPGVDVVDTRPAGRTLTVELPEDAAGDRAAAAEQVAGVAAVVPETTYTLFDTPDDPEYASQATSLGALDLPRAWDVTHGSTTVTVAVLDTGVAVDHPDLQGKVVGTYNATTGTTGAAAVRDVEGHGTMVASIAAASTGNGSGMAGSGWDTSLLAVKVAASDGTISNGDLADGIDWAVGQGADVINLSLGSATNDLPVRAAVARAVAADVVVVAAAGNFGSNAKFYPAALDGVVAVGATTVGGGARASFSEYGSWVDVGAPGGSIVGANAKYATQADYVVGSGTSFASPLVAGAAALVRASRPELDAHSVRAALRGTATAKDYGFARGLVDAYAALGYGLVLDSPSATVTNPAHVGSVDVDVTAPVSVMADQVRIGIAGGPTVLAPLVGRAATVTVPTYGWDGGQHVEAVLCRQTLCSSSGTRLDLTVDNPPPVITAPAGGTQVVADFTVSATSTAPAVRFVADGTIVLGTVTGPDLSLVVPLTALTPGAHELRAVVCDAEGTVCASGKPSAQVAVTVDRLSPSLVAVAPTPFSPDGDGRRDGSRITFDLDVASAATVRLVDGGGTSVRTIDLGPLGAGRHSLVWGGKRDDGSLVPSATYRVVLDTVATVGGVELHGQAAKSVTVDRVHPHLSAARTTYSTVYPVKDGYRDTTALTVSVAEPVAKLTVTVYDGRGRAVWSATKEDRPAGRVGATFRGRSSKGTVLAPGRYTYAFRVVDKAFNVTTTAKHPVSVSAKRLSKHTSTRTVTALASFDVWYTDDTCSGLYRSTWSSGALHWEACPGGYVLSVHHATLPKAAVYGSARVSMYGRGGAGSVALFRYLDDHDRFVGAGTRFGDSTGTHRAASVSVTAALLAGRKLRWSVEVGDGDAYAAKTFTVTTTYYTLG